MAVQSAEAATKLRATSVSEIEIAATCSGPRWPSSLRINDAAQVSRVPEIASPLHRLRSLGAMRHGASFFESFNRFVFHFRILTGGILLLRHDHLVSSASDVTSSEGRDHSRLAIDWQVACRSRSASLGCIRRDLSLPALSPSLWQGHREASFPWNHPEMFGGRCHRRPEFP